MPATKMAPIQIVSENEELARIESEYIMRVLVVEDELRVRERTVRKLEEAGFSVDAFPTPREAAEKLRPNEYQLVIMDIRFDAPNISGDEFIHKNADAFTNARVVAFTGHQDDIFYNDVFDEVFLKGQLRNPLYDYAEETYRDRQKAVARQIESELTSESEKTEQEQLDAVFAQSKVELIRVLNETRDKDKKLVWYKGRDFSAKELVDEVQNQTSVVGKSHVRMMAEWLFRKKGN